MPVVFRHGGLRYFFFSNEGVPREPIHVHVKGRGCDAKIWVEPEIQVAESYGFNSRELADILKLLEANRDRIVEAWHDHFAN